MKQPQDVKTKEIPELQPQGESPLPEGFAPVPLGGSALAEIPDDDFSDQAGVGLDNLGKDDLSIPFLIVLQGLSPQVQRSKGEYVEGAAEGMLFNTVTKQVIDPIKTPVYVIPCHYDRNFVEWRVREKGGGFVGQHSVAKGLELQQSTIRDEKNRDVLPNGNQLNDTRTFFVMVQVGDDEVPSPAVITMTSTQIKKGKQWLMQQNLLKRRNNAGQQYTPPMFASRWRVSTVPDQNEKGSWMAWSFEHAGYLSGKSDPLFIVAQKFHKEIAAGAVKVDLAKAAEAEGTGGGGRMPGGVSDNLERDDDIPF